MNRIVTVVAVLIVFVGCKKAIPTSEVIDDFTEMTKKMPPPSPDAIAEVEAVLENTVIRFEYDRDLLSSEAMQSLQKLAKVLRKHPNVNIMVAGNCDERGTEEYNFLLGQRRAEAARHYLWVLGVREGQVESISYGAELPLDFGQDEAAFTINRRDDLSVQRDGQAVSVTAAPAPRIGPME